MTKLPHAFALKEMIRRGRAKRQALLECDHQLLDAPVVVVPPAWPEDLPNADNLRLPFPCVLFETVDDINTAFFKPGDPEWEETPQDRWYILVSDFCTARRSAAFKYFGGPLTPENERGGWHLGV